MRGHGLQALRSGKADRGFAAKPRRAGKVIRPPEIPAEISRMRAAPRTGARANPGSLPPACAQALRPALATTPFRPAQREERGCRPPLRRVRRHGTAIAPSAYQPARVV